MKGDSKGTCLLAQEKAFRAVSVLPIKYWGFRFIHRVSYCCRKTAYESAEDPALCSVKKSLYASAYVRPTSKGLESIGIGDTVVYPVR
jgi:hypothetical protein